MRWASARASRRGGLLRAVSFHLDEQDAALAQMRANIDAWWPLVRDGRVEAIVMNASGCGAMVKEYAHHLRNDPAYAQRAADIVALVRTWPRSSRRRRRRCARACRKRRARPFIRRARCSIGRPAALVGAAAGGPGIRIAAVRRQASVLRLGRGVFGAEPDIALELRDRKLSAIAAGGPDVILSANIGCIGHLQSGTDTPVRHWVEVVDELLRQPADGRRQEA